MYTHQDVGKDREVASRAGEAKIPHTLCQRDGDFGNRKAQKENEDVMSAKEYICGHGSVKTGYNRTF